MALIGYHLLPLYAYEYGLKSLATAVALKGHLVFKWSLDFCKDYSDFQKVPVYGSRPALLYKIKLGVIICWLNLIWNFTALSIAHPTPLVILLIRLKNHSFDIGHFILMYSTDLWLLTLHPISYNVCSKCSCMLLEPSSYYVRTFHP